MRFVDRVIDPFSRVYADAARYFAAKQQRARDYGFAQVAYAAIMSRLARLGFQLFLVELGDDRPDIAMPRLSPGYTAQPIDLEALRPWVGREGYDLSAAFLQGAIQRGDRCVANFYHGELVGYGFVTCVGAPATRQLQVAIDDRLVYRYKGWTHPDHRRKHLSHARGRLNRQFFPLTDGRRTVAFVDVANLAAKLKHADIHPVRLGYCGYVRICGREFPFTQRVPRRFGFRLVRSPVDYL
jgi:hypothetical protein